jgi:polyketide synthase 13
VPIGGEHIQAIDEPYIAKVGAHMSEAISRTQSEATNQVEAQKEAQ